MDLFAARHQPVDWPAGRAEFATILELVLADHSRVPCMVWQIRSEAGLPMSVTIAEKHIRDAGDQHSQQDSNASMLKAMSELTRQIKRLDDEVRRARRDAQMSRRF